jgi:glucose-1-phosphate adenylyltransferase
VSEQECIHLGYCPYKNDPAGVPTGQFVRHTVAYILAGGRGTRLGELTDWRSKPAVPFGGKFRIIDFTLSNCVNSGIRRVVIATQYKAQSLIRHIQRGWSFLDGRFNEFIELVPAQQRVTADWYKGTADAVFQNLDLLRRQQPEYVLVLAGDHVYKMDYGKMIAEHVARKADMTVGCIEVPVAEAARQLGVMSVDADFRINGFQEKPAEPRPIPGRDGMALGSMGIYVFNANFLYEQLIRNADDRKSGHDFGHDLIPYLIGRGYRVYAHRLDDSCVQRNEGQPYWRDSPALDLYDQDWPIWTYQEQLPPAKFIFDDEGRRGAAMDSMVSGGCIISGSTVRRSLLFSSVRINSYCTIEDSVILPQVEVGRHAVLKRVVIDKACNIPPGLHVGVDPVEDRKRFHVTDKGVTLITPEMLGQVVHHLR